MDEKSELFFLQYLYEFASGKKEKWMKRTSSTLEVFAFIILILGLTVPIKIFDYEWVGEICTFLAFEILFFNIWLMEFSRNRIRQWSELQMFNMLFKDSASGEENGGIKNGEIENALGE